MGKDSYREWLRQDFTGLIDSLELTDREKHVLRSRWLDQVLWMEGRADSARNRYYLLRLTAVVGGVVIPALVSLNVGSGLAAPVVRGATFGLSLLVAIALAVEEFMRFGDRWRHYRRTVELIKAEGWQFLQLSGSYRSYPSHRAAYASFATRVEALIQPSIEVYVTEVAAENKEDKGQLRAP
ncbi:MAG TPA: DUF4231 domain-containing protein [Nitriliruptorales bacterium]|nr:DUF4231 domain-containing protein [Nitriliruptorales bacterium]